MAAGAGHGLPQLLRRHEGHAEVAGLVLVRGQHPRRARAQGAVGEELDAADPQHVVAEAGAQAGGDRLVQPTGGDRLADPESPLAALAQELPGPQGADAVEVVDPGQAAAPGDGQGGGHGVGHLFRRHLRQLVRHQAGGRLEEDPRGLAGPVADHGAAGGVLGAAGHARGGEGRGVRPRGMAALGGEEDGVVRSGAVQELARGQLAGAPAVVVPAVAEDPLAGRGGGGLVADGLQHVLQPRQVGVDAGQAEGEALEVEVGVHQARQHAGALEGEALRRSGRGGQDLVVGAGGGDAPASDPQGFGRRPAVLQGAHPAAVEYEIAVVAGVVHRISGGHAYLTA